MGGNSHRVLEDPNSIVLSEKLALKYFGSDNPIGETIFLNDSIPLTVTGVFATVPSNSVLRFEAVLSMRRVEKMASKMDLSLGTLFICYLKLLPGSDPSLAERKIDKVLKKYYREEFKKWNWNISGLTAKFIPLHGVAFEVIKTKSKFLLSVFRFAGLVIIAVAWINYINLMISMNGKRLKELAARLVVGACYRHCMSGIVRNDHTKSHCKNKRDWNPQSTWC